MLKLLTECNKCIHKRTCKYYNHPKQAMEKLKNTTYGDGPNDDYGWGGFLIDKLGNKHILQGSGKEMELCKMRNVAGEILGASAAIQTALKLGMEKLTIYYNYEGVEKWVTGKWRTKKKGTMDYAALAKSAMMSGLKLYFKHVKAHSGVPFNEEADNLAKKSVGLG